MEGVKGVSQLKLQPKLSEVQKKVQAMCEWKKYVIQKKNVKKFKFKEQLMYIQSLKSSTFPLER